MKTQDIEYHADGARLVGYLVVDDAKAGKRPGIIVAHEGGEGVGGGQLHVLRDRGRTDVESSAEDPGEG